MQENIGKRVKTREFLRRVDEALGQGAHKRLQLRCVKGNLVDVYIHLPEVLDNHSLQDLVIRAPEAYANRCGKTFRIDPIGIGS